MGNIMPLSSAATCGTVDNNFKAKPVAGKTLVIEYNGESEMQLMQRIKSLASLNGSQATGRILIRDDVANATEFSRHLSSVEQFNGWKIVRMSSGVDAKPFKEGKCDITI